MANKFMPRMLQILGEASKDVGKEYFSNATAFINDAKDVKNSIIKTGTDASDTFAKLKRTNITKGIHDWFYNEENLFNMFESEAAGDAEFDPGFKVDSSEDEEKDNTPKALTQESMADISTKQTSTMIKIGRRQTEQTVANTAEIVSVVNTRTSEMITAMNNINKSLLGISDRLDKIIKISAGSVSDENDSSTSKEIDKDALFSDGKLSLTRIFEQAKKGLGSNALLGNVSAFKDLLKSGVTPTNLATLGIDFALSNIKLGGASIKDIGERFNDTIGSVAQTAMNEMINSSVFKGIFGDITKFEGDKNYKELVKSTYDKKKATFDGMTRYSIVNVIPEMLSLINESISGVKYRLDNQGKWISGPMKNEFVEVTHNTFNSSGLQSNTMNEISNSFKNSSYGQAIPVDHIEVAGKALTMAIISTMFESGSRSFTMSQLNNDMSKYINIAVPPLCMLGINSSPGYWAMVCQTIVLKLGSGMMDSAAFIANINQSLESTIREAADYAQSGKSTANQATMITPEMITKEFVKKNQVSESSSSQPESSTSSNSSTNTSTYDTSNSNAATMTSSTEDARKIRVESNEKIKRGDFDTIDYLHGIFGILNRGINVAVEKNGEAYGNYSLHRKSVDKDEGINSAGRMFQNFFGGNKDALKEAIKSGMANAVGPQNAEIVRAIRQQGVASFAGRMTGGVAANLINKSGIFDKIKTGADKVKEKTTSLFDSAKTKVNASIDNLKYDRRYNELRGTVAGVPDKVKDVAEDAKNIATGAYHYANDKANDFVDRHKGLRRIKNNLMYRKDSAALAYAQDKFKNLETDREALSNLSETDQNKFIAITRSVNKGTLNDRVSRAIDKVEDENARNLLRSNFDTIDSITKKRKKGEADVADGKVADIGAVMDTSKGKAGKLFDVVKDGFMNVGSLLGKITKSLAKLGKSGLLDIRYGLQSIKEGLVGYKEKDENGNKIKHGGIFQNAAKIGFAPLAIPAKGISALAKGAGKLANKWLDKEVESTDDEGNKITTTRRDKIRNKKFSYTYGYDEEIKSLGAARFGRKYDEEGNVDDNGIQKRFGYSKYTKDKSTKENVVTIGDILDSPGKALAQSMKNIKTEISKSGIGNALRGVGSHLKKFSESIKGVVSKITGFTKGLVSDFKKLPGIEGFFKGFDRAKEAKKAAERRAKEKQYREDNPAVAHIEDSLIKNPDSFLGKIHTKFDELLNMLREYHKDDMDAAEEAEENADKRAEEANSSDNSNNETSAIVSSESSSTASSGTSLSSISGGGSATGGESASTGGGAGSKIKGAISGGLGFVKDALNSVGQTLGGIFQTVLGVFKVVASILGGLSAFQAIMTMVESIWKDGIKPLNKGLMHLKKALMPIVQTLKNSVRAIASAVSAIFTTILKSFQPILEIINSLLTDIMDLVLKPVLDILTGSIEFLSSIFGSVNKIQPAVSLIADLVEFTAGIVTFGIGSVLILLGEILSGMGNAITIISGLISRIPVIGTVASLIKGDEIGRKIKSVGDQMGSSGNDLIASAKTLFSEAVGNLKSHFFQLFESPGEATQETVDTGKVDTSQVHMREEMGAGNVNTNTVNNSWTYMYGSGNTSSMNQHNYGGYMNMSERGCGPVALADAFARRTGVGVNPANMARSMMASGNYDPRRGSSVGSMMSASSALGMGVTLGGVTQSSLNRATPSNPITLLGSGPGFGTKVGNNHYVNVVGTDAMGGAYVSNPMSGRIERHSKSQLALNSKLGLYGSGDNDMYDIADSYGLNYDTADALKILDELGQRLTAIFGVEGAAASAKKKIKAEENAVKAQKIKDKLGDEYEAIETQAKEELRKNYPKRDGETDEAYEKRIERLWAEKKDEYIIKYGSESAIVKNDQMLNDIQSGVDTLHEGVQQSLKSMQQIHPGGSAYVGAVMADFEPINNYQTDINGDDSDRSTVHDYFSATSGYHAHTKNGGWFKKQNNPNKYGEGSKGYPHEGISIWFDTDEYEDSPEVHAITKGTAVYVGHSNEHGKKDVNGGLGNHVKFIDDSGMYHWFMHLADLDDSIQEGSNIEPNQLIGHVGSTGATGDDEEGRPNKYLRYVLTRSGPFGKTNDKGYENPLKYWDWYEPGSIPGTNAVGSNGSANASGLPGGISSDNGVVLTDKFGAYKYTDVDMDDVYDDRAGASSWPGSSKRHASKHAPILEFFKNSQPDKADAYVDSSGYGHWYWNRANPDKYGKGQSNMGSGLQASDPNTIEHGGVDIQWEGGSDGRELHAPTGGEVIDAKSCLGADGAGHQIAWVDSGGKAHWFVHMKDAPLKKTGDKIEAGDLVGYAGQSGGTSGGYSHLHYAILDPEFAGVTTCDPNSGMENPINYFHNYSPMASGTDSAGNADYSTPDNSSSGTSSTYFVQYQKNKNNTNNKTITGVTAFSSPTLWQHESSARRDTFYDQLKNAHIACTSTTDPFYDEEYTKKYRYRKLNNYTPEFRGYWKAGYEMTIKGKSPQDINNFAIHVSDLAKAYANGGSEISGPRLYGVGGPDDESSMTGVIPFEGMLEKHNLFGGYTDNPGVMTFINTAQSVGMTPAQMAVVMATGIKENSGSKIFNGASMTDQVRDPGNGAMAAGIMNFASEDDQRKAGSTVESQLKFILDTYFSPSSDDWRALMRHTEFDDVDFTAFKAATGRNSWGMDFGERYGPVMETDLIAGSEQYFRGALVPGCIHDTDGVGVAQHIGTTIGAYNWMAKQGIAGSNNTLTTSAGNAEYAGGSGGAVGKPRFVASMSNYLGGDWISVGQGGGSGLGAAVNANGGAGGVDAVIQSAVEVADAFNTTNPDAQYKGGDGSLKYRDGSTQSGFRADCSGYTGEILRHMGYYGDEAGNNIIDPSQITGEKEGSPRIYDSSGNLTSDWTSIKYSESKLQRGDILYMGVGDGSAHTDMYLTGTNNNAHGLNFGSNDYVMSTKQVGTKYLDEGGDLDKMVTEAGIGSMPSDSYMPTMILRYTVPVTTTSSGTADYSIDSGGNTEKAIWNALIKGGLSPEQAAGMMGNFTHESGLRSNNLQDSYEGPLGYSDESYTSAVDSKKYSKNSFVNDDAGYGLAQWTYWSGKQHLYEKTVEKGKSISDIGSQIDLALTEYPNVTSGLKQQKTVKDATLYWMNEYERPGITATENRLAAANKYYNMFRTSAGNANYGIGGPADSISYFTSMSGAKMAPFGNPNHKKTNITSGNSGESPVHDFFGATNGNIDDAYSGQGNWYTLRNDPDKTGTGSSGGSHSGIDINWVSGSEGKEVHAITGGTVDQVQGGGYNGRDSNGGCGNNIRWLDDGGYIHWYMHMRDDPLAKVGDTIQPGQLLGYVGNTGWSDGAHLHYNVNKAEGFAGNSGSNAINPLTYWSGYDENGSYIDGSLDGSESSGSMIDAIDTESMLRTRKLSGQALGAKERGGFANAEYYQGSDEYTDNPDEHMTYEEIVEIINNLTPDVSDIYTVANAYNTLNAAAAASSSSGSISSSGSSSSGSSGSSDSGSGTSSSGSFLQNFMTNMKNTASELAQVKKLKDEKETPGAMADAVKDLKNKASDPYSPTAYDPDRPFAIFSASEYKNHSGSDRNTAFGQLKRTYDIVKGIQTPYNPNLKYDSDDAPVIRRAYDNAINRNKGSSNLNYMIGGITTPAAFNSSKDWQYSYHAWESGKHQFRDGYGYDLHDFPNYLSTLHSAYINNAYAAGDVSPYDYEIPALDTSGLNLYDDAVSKQIVPIFVQSNNNDISTDDSRTTEILNKMSELTFNVRAERVEQLLEKLIETVQNGQNEKNEIRSQNAMDPNLFRNNSIPEQISSLARG